MKPINILHLAGSPTSDFFAELSLVYARGCDTALGGIERYNFIRAFVSPNGLWRFPQSFDQDAINATRAMPFAQAIGYIAAAEIDIALPQMFCLSGMTDFRALLDVMQLPYLGNRPLQMALTADKAKTRAVVARAGVAIPRGELLRFGEIPKLAPPVVVKPNSADNSDGIALVRSHEEYTRALETAFDYSPFVLVEDYIELGREVRCGVLVRDEKLVCLPLEEYAVDAEQRPIRKREHKLGQGAANTVTLMAKTDTQSWIVPISDPLTDRVWVEAKLAHEALGCEQYSLFDFRIDPHGKPWFLESGLYCSFSPQSVIPTMAAAAGMPLAQLFEDSIRELIGR